MNRHVENPEGFSKHREEVTDKAHDILTDEEDDCGKADPRVQAIQIWDFGHGIVVGIENCDESKEREDKCEAMDGCVCDFQASFTAESESTVN